MGSLYVKPIYEFLMWDNCSNNCAFCFQRNNPRIFNCQKQAVIVSHVLDYLNSGDFEYGSHVLFVGGELFDDYNRHDFLIQLFKYVVNLVKNGAIDQLYLNTNLIYDEQCLEVVIKIISIFNDNNVLSHLHFTTSYDVNGRFKTKEDEKLFFNNLVLIRKVFPELNIFVNSILTKHMCDCINNNSFNVNDFQQKWNVNVNIIPYIVKDQILAPTRNELFKALKCIFQQNQRFFRNFLVEQDFKEPRRMMYFKDDKWIRCECKTSECGHSSNFKMYSTQNTCFVCDIKALFKGIAL